MSSSAVLKTPVGSVKNWSFGVPSGARYGWCRARGVSWMEKSCASGVCRSFGHDGLRGRAHRSRLVHRLAGLVEQAALQVLPDARRKEVELPPLDRRDQAGPEDRAAAEVQLRLLADVVLRARIPALPERVAAEVLRQARVREPAEVVDVRRIDERPGFEHENPLVIPETVGEVVGEHAAADARADDDDVEVVARSDVLQEQPLLRGARGRNEVCVRREH